MSNVTDTLVMVEPLHFAYNTQTADSNAFQAQLAESDRAVHDKAMTEFEKMVTTLENYGITVTVLPSPGADAPDAVFPNNWFSTHVKDGQAQIFIYPMYSVNRQYEVQLPTLHTRLKQLTGQDYAVIDWRAPETPALEGTGAFVFDRNAETAFMAPSPRADRSLAEQVVSALDYKLFCFSSVDQANQPIYHTNVVMSIGEKLAFICFETIPDENEKMRLSAKLAEMNKTVIALDYHQVCQMAANVLEVKNKQQKHYLLLSQRADNALTSDQKMIIDHYCQRVPLAIDTIETVGGGSVRCMLAEVFY